MTDLAEPFRSLFETNMGIKPQERILVFSDTVRPDEHPDPLELDRRQRLLAVAEAVASYAEKQYGGTTFISYPATPASGAEPPESLWRAAFGEETVNRLIAADLLDRLLSKRATSDEVAQSRTLVLEQSTSVSNVVIALANNSTSHTTFRALVNVAGGRYASLPHFDPDMFQSSMRVDWQALAERTRRVAEVVNGGVAVEISSGNGSRLTLRTDGRIAKGDDGILTAAGSFGNLPAGEVYLAPLEGTAEGKLVLEWGPTQKFSSPIELEVRQGNVVSLRGDDPYCRQLEEKFAESAKNRNIAELGIGTNDRATRPDNVLEAEKILGTIHIALGDNAGFGGTVQTPFHEDFVFYQPTVEIIAASGARTKLLQAGKLLV